MSDKIHYAKTIRNLATMFKDMVEAADALEAIGSVEQASQEASVMTERLRGQVAELIAQRDDVFAEIDRAKADKAALLADAAAEARKLLQDASDKAERVSAEIEQSRALSISEAKRVADGVIREASQKKTDLENEIETLKLSASETRAEILLAQDELSSLQTKISEAKAKIAAFIGG